MSRRRKFVLGGATAVVLLIAAVSVASGGDSGTSVSTERVGARDLTSVVTASGKVEPQRKVDISADIAGRVIEVAVDEGDMVERGDLLLRIDPSRFAAAVRRAEAAVAQARASEAQARAGLLRAQSAHERAERLRGEGDLISSEQLEDAATEAAVSEAQHEAARFGVEQAQATLAEAREDLRNTTITAPMSGRITRLNIEEGETAVVGTMNNPGSLLLTVADLSVMEARIQVDETDVPQISLGDSATVRVDAFRDRVFSGHVSRISHSALQNAGGNGESVDFEVVITLSEPPVELRPDLSATADVVTASRDGALAIPILSLTVRTPEGRRLGQGGAENGEEEEEVEGVFLVEDGRARFTPVSVGIVGDRYFEVLEGLSGGEVLVSGSYNAVRDLEDGASLRVPGSRAADRGEPDSET